MNRFECILCRTTPVPDTYSSERICGFKEDGSFNPDNWNCETLKAYREKAYELEDNYVRSIIRKNNGQSFITFVVDHDDKHIDFLCMGWYKNRGRTENLFMLSESEIKPVTRDDTLKLTILIE